MTVSTPDLIDALVDVRPDDAVDRLRRRRPVTREQLQSSHDALFEPIDDAEFPLAERLLVAAFATRSTSRDRTAEHYAAAARGVAPDLVDAVLSEASAAATAGPFGRYTEAGLRAEDADGRRYAPGPDVVDALGERLAAALAHAHLLTFRPREAGSADQRRLLEAGWSVDGIVTLSQLISFLAFQQRVAHGLRVLATTTEVSA